MGGGSPTYNYPEQPSYGEGMADALKAQVELLTGTGDFQNTGSLESLLPLEESIRKKTAQTDTDILRQTLGSERKVNVVKDPETGKFGIPNSKIVTDLEGTVSNRFQVFLTESDSPYAGDSRKYEILDTNTGAVVTPTLEEFYLSSGVLNKKADGSYEKGDNFNERFLKSKQLNSGLTTDSFFDNITSQAESGEKHSFYDASELGQQDFANWYKYKTGGASEQELEAVFDFTDPNTGEPFDITEGKEITIREGDGMVDLLGDKRTVSEFTTRQATQEDVAAGLASEVGESITEATGGRKAGFDADGNFLGLSALAEDIQRGNLSRQREADLADVERLSDRYQNVMEDYKPAATSGVDGARELLEEQKTKLTEGGGVITKPEGSTFADGLEGQTMTAAQVGQGPTLDASTSYNPSASVSGGTFDADTSYSASQVADPLRLQAATSYDPSASVEGRGYTATAGVEGGNIGADSLRAALLADAETALGQGLTEREQAQIANSARARQTLMGRTFDQQGAIEEAQALIAEDNNRRMQNRGFAQSALGQEADIQRDDLGRGLQAQLQNQAALNQAAQFGASQDMQAQLANQAARNQALQQGVTAGLSQEALAAQQAQAKAMADASAANQASQFGVSAGLQQESQANQAALQAQLANQSATNQARAAGLQAGLSQDAQQAQLDQASNLAQAELTQQANAFGAQSAQQAALANQAQQQQANQFAVGAQMDAERIDESLRQQGLGNYINAVGNLAQIEDQYMLDPFQALLGRGGGGSLQAGQSVFGQAGYGLNSGPQYLNPESGLGYISNMAANQANMYAANVAADASRSAGLMGGLGAIGGGLLQGAGAAGSFGTFSVG